MTAARNPKPKPPKRKYEYRVRWLRVGRVHAQGRVYQSAPFAERLCRRLNRAYDIGLAPLRWVTVERRQVGPWEPYDDDRGEH